MKLASALKNKDLQSLQQVFCHQCSDLRPEKKPRAPNSKQTKACRNYALFAPNTRKNIAPFSSLLFLMLNRTAANKTKSATNLECNNKKQAELLGQLTNYGGLYLF